MGDLEAVGDEADVRCHARNSSCQGTIADNIMTDDVLGMLRILTVDAHCSLNDLSLRCDLGDYEPGQREDIMLRVAATQGVLDAHANIKGTKPIFIFVPA